MSRVGAAASIARTAVRQGPWAELDLRLSRIMHDAEIDLLVGIGMTVAGTARWTWIWPALAWTILLITLVLGGGEAIYAAAGAALFGTVFAAVYHAEMVAHRVGEPFGTLILALAVTRIPESDFQ